MSKLHSLFIFLILFSCSEKEGELTSSEYRDIIELISTEDFEQLKSFMINNGNREGYSNIYNSNPHYSFDGFEAYLNPEIGQANINCDTEISDFNELVIRDQDSYPQYFHILIVRRGDLIDNQIISTISDMKENKIYLLKNDEYDLDDMKNKVVTYIDIMKGVIE